MLDEIVAGRRSESTERDGSDVPPSGHARTRGWSRARQWAAHTLVMVAAMALIVGSSIPGSAGAADTRSGASEHAAKVGVSSVGRRVSAVRPRPQARTAAPAPVATAAPTVILYGDSLAWEGQDHFRDTLATAGIDDVHLRTYGGTAICDWLQSMRADATGLHPAAVVVEFGGNALTPCMHGPDGTPLTGDAYIGKYLDDAIDVVRIFRPTGARIYFAGAPITQHAQDTDDPNATLFNTLYAALAASDPGVRYIDAGAAVLDHGHWTKTLPCLPGEPCTDGTDPSGLPVNVVRAPDGTHFCPTAPDAIQGVTSTCPVWSSGAYRYGTAIATPIIQDLAPNTRTQTAKT